MPAFCDAEMDDIEGIPESLPDHLRNAITQTGSSTTTVGTQTCESHNSMLQPQPFLLNRQCSDFDEAFFANDDEKVKFYTGLPSCEILHKVFFLLNLTLTGVHWFYPNFKNFPWF